MKYFHKILMASICLVSLTVSAQWQWTDKDGRKVYSDRAPPSDVPEKNIMKRPGNRVAAPATTDSSLNAPKAAPDMASASAAQASASAPKVSGVEKELLEKKKKAEEADVAKRKAEEERIVKEKIENCARAKQAKSNFDSGVRMTQPNAKGEREIMNDAARNAEVKRIQSIIDADCK